ncbi:MAG: branched-chain amino acid transport system permease protein [Chloroflexota bacterium]|nr:branched-chain amino acid transport system permease protein [Chloroflexota bacterium]
MKRPSSRVKPGIVERVRRFEIQGLGAVGRGRNVPYLLLGIALILFPVLDSDSSHVNVAADAGHWILLALGLNIVVGYAGLLDLGYAAFFAIGSYAFAIMASGQFNIHISFWILLPVSALIAALFGVLLGAPTLRLRGDYLAIVTLGFGEIVPRVFRNATPFTGGVNGIVGIDQPHVPHILGWNGNFGFNPVPWYYLILIIIIVSIWLINNLRNSRLGRAWMAIREDEVAAAATGINTVTTKLLAFSLGASFSGFAGTYYASKLFLVVPESFSFQAVSVVVLVMVVLGGMGNIRGVIVGAILIYFIQTYLLIQLPNWIDSATSALNIDFLTKLGIGGYVQRSNYLIFGIILAGIMLLRPQGLIPSAQRKAELELGTSEEAVADLGSA